MFDFLTNLLFQSHIVAGFFAILVGLGALCAPKFSPLHFRCGRAFVWLLIYVSLSGTILMADPAFGSIKIIFLADQEGLGQVLKSSEYFEVLFLWLTIGTLYVTLSGPRVWGRIRASRDGRITSNKWDWILAILVVPFSIMFFVIGIIDLTQGDRMGTEFIVFSIGLLVIVLFDMVTFAKRPSISQYPWWMIHMVKMVLAFGAVVYAVYLRHALQLPEFLQVRFFSVFLTVPMIAIYLWIYRKNLLKGPMPSHGH